MHMMIMAIIITAMIIHIKQLVVEKLSAIAVASVRKKRVKYSLLNPHRIFE